MILFILNYIPIHRFNRDTSNEICFSINTFRGMNKSTIYLILSEFEWFYITLGFRYDDIYDKLYINR
jgi:hypothetical protein